MSQPYSPAYKPYNPLYIKKLDARKIMSEASTIGLEKLKKIVNPMILVYLDSSFVSTLIELEFKSGFLSRSYPSGNVVYYHLPDYTFLLATEHNNKEAQEKLFEYYIQIPKFAESDTIYSIYNNLDKFLKVLVKSKNPNLRNRLLQDYKEWSELARISNLPGHIERYRNMPLDEIKNFYADCSYIALQLAGALNYLKVAGFDNELLENLKKQLPYHPRAAGFKFQVFDFAYNRTNDHIKVVPNTELITNFDKDYHKIENFLFKHIDNCCEAKITSIIYDNLKAYIFVQRHYMYDDYLLKLNTDNTITIEPLTMTHETPAFY